jgi:hypothetical protein
MSGQDLTEFGCALSSSSERSLYIVRTPATSLLLSEGASVRTSLTHLPDGDPTEAIKTPARRILTLPHKISSLVGCEFPLFVSFWLCAFFSYSRIMSVSSPPRRVRQRLVEDRAAIQAKIMDSSVIAERNILRADIMVPPLDNILDIIQTYNWGYLHSCACQVYTRLVKLFYANLEVVQNDDRGVVLQSSVAGHHC